MGAEVSVFLSDVTAAADWPLAEQALRMLDIPVPDDEDLDQVLPAGDLSIFADMGLEEWELCAIAGDLDLFPDEAVASIAGGVKRGGAPEAGGADGAGARGRARALTRAGSRS